MMKLYKDGAFLLNRRQLVLDQPQAGLPGKPPLTREEARANTMAYRILQAHNTARKPGLLRLRFDALASHDITYVGIIQTALASGLREFPLPYVLTNCHNSLCAVGGTINQDDHLFGLSAARRFGGIYVPAHQAVIHQYMREQFAGCGRMILGSDSHTRYGALGCMAMGEGGPELVKQLLGRTYDLPLPQVVGVYLTGKPAPGVGPQDVALSIIREVFANGFVKNRVMEFVGDGIAGLGVEYRSGIDVMTTETTCLSSIWETDDKVRRYLELHGRGEDYAPLAPGEVAYYDRMMVVDLSAIQPMIALPFHPSNAYPIWELQENLEDILHQTEVEGQRQLGDQVAFSLTDKIVDGRLLAGQGVIGGCAGGSYENLWAAAEILAGSSTGNGEFELSLYPSSQPIFLRLTQTGAAARLMTAGATLRTAFCGPCFGAGDVPGNNVLSLRHSTRNFPNREGSKPSGGQSASVALMDARSIAATARNGGFLTAATQLEEVGGSCPDYRFDGQVYQNRVYRGWGNPQPETPLRYGPNIRPWPQMYPLPSHLLLLAAAVIRDPVTTTDELIPSGETSSYRSNPLQLAEFTLSRKEPAYVGRAKEARGWEEQRRGGAEPAALGPVLAGAWSVLERQGLAPCWGQTGLGSLVCAVKPGDGSAREQAASCQKVLGGWANLAREYATKRYHSNLINWGLLPLRLAGEGELPLSPMDLLYLPDIRRQVEQGERQVVAYLVQGDSLSPLTLELPYLTGEERQILLSGCLINHYRSAAGPQSRPDRP